MIGVHRVTRITFFFTLSTVIFVAGPSKIFMKSFFFFFQIATTAMIAVPSKKTGSQRHRVFNSISVTHGVATCQVKIHKPFWTQFCRVRWTTNGATRRGAARAGKSTVTENRIIALRAINVRLARYSARRCPFRFRLIEQGTSIDARRLAVSCSSSREKERRTKRKREQGSEIFARCSNRRDRYASRRASFVNSCKLRLRWSCDGPWLRYELHHVFVRVRLEGKPFFFLLLGLNTRPVDKLIKLGQWTLTGETLIPVACVTLPVITKSLS